ncbi:hypothetical protein ACROYT_G016784 [Oculina patagonica]
MTKTEFILIGYRQRLSNLTGSSKVAINDFQVSQVKSAKSLGVIIDDRHDWSGHIEKLTKKIASGIGALKRVRHLVPQATLHLIYRALIQPHFDYCSTVWGNCEITLQNKLQKLQNRAARVLTFSNYDAHAGDLFEILGWKNLARQQQIQRATMVYRSLHGLAPDYLSSKFEKRETAYNLRHSENKLNVPLPRTNYYKNSFTSIDMVANSTWRHFCFTWENTNGVYKSYKDGKLEAQGVDFQKGYILRSGGTVVLGQDQDSIGGGFNTNDAFVGEMIEVNMWGSVLSESDIAAQYENCSIPHGSVLAWPLFKDVVHGQVQVVEP